MTANAVRIKRADGTWQDIAYAGPPGPDGAQGIPGPQGPSGVGAQGVNQVRNGDMSVWQRGSAGSFTASGYTADGWSMQVSGGSMTVTKAIYTPGTSDGRSYINCVFSGQSAAGDYAYLYQPIEDAFTLGGKFVTVSFNASAAVAGSKIGVEFIQFFGSGGGGSGPVNTTAGAVTVTTSGGRYSVTVAIPSISGKGFGVDGNDSLRLLLWFSAGSTYNTRAGGIGIQANTFRISDVQVEAGQVATPFERISQQQQLAWCQRYYWRATGSQVGGIVADSTAIIVDQPFPVVMRKAPTLAASGLPHVWDILYQGGTHTISQSVSPQYASTTRGRWVYAQSGMNGVGARIVSLQASHYLEATAEL